jgi:hypothetical protein
MLALIDQVATMDIARSILAECAFFILIMLKNELNGFELLGFNSYLRPVETPHWGVTTAHSKKRGSSKAPLFRNSRNQIEGYLCSA